MKCKHSPGRDNCFNSEQFAPTFGVSEILFISVVLLQGVKRSVDNFKISPYTSAEIIAVKVHVNPRLASLSRSVGSCRAMYPYTTNPLYSHYPLQLCADSIHTVTAYVFFVQMFS